MHGFESWTPSKWHTGGIPDTFVAINLTSKLSVSSSNCGIAIKRNSLQCPLPLFELEEAGVGNKLTIW